MIAAWAAFWLWVTGGVAGTDLLMVLGTTVIYVFGTFVPLAVVFERMKISHRALQNAYLGIIVVTFLGMAPVMVIMWDTASIMNKQFERCIRETQIVERSGGESTLYMLHCSTRETLNDEWSNFKVHRVSIDPIRNGPVSTLIDIPGGK